MILDRSVVGRFNVTPEGKVLPAEYLCRETALFAEAEWFWSTEKAQAHIFPTHAEADQRALEMTKQTGRTCIAAVLPGIMAPPREAAPEKLEPTRAAALPRTGRRYLSATEAEAEWQRTHDA